MNLLNNIFWLVLSMALLAWLQSRLHREVQLFFLLVTRRPRMAVVLFALVFFPGVLLHELSHYLTAKLLRVPTGRFSIFPKNVGDGRLQLGYVEVAAADPIRESLIGAAPLLAGSAFVAYAGLVRLGLDSIWVALTQKGLGSGVDELFSIFEQADVWLWLYLALTISSTMFPSASDRQPMLKTLIGFIILLAIVLLLGAGYWLLDLVGPGLARIMGAAVVIFGISNGLHVVLLIPLILIRLLLAEVLGVEVQTVKRVKAGD